MRPRAARSRRRMIVPVAVAVNVCVEVVEARTGRLLAQHVAHNLVVDAGLNQLRDFMFGDAPAIISHGAVGTDATAPAALDTALGAEVFRDVILARVKTAKTLTIRYVLGSQQANGNTLAEAGLFNAAAGGTMYARVTPASIAKTDAISVLYNWTLSFSSS